MIAPCSLIAWIILGCSARSPSATRTIEETATSTSMPDRVFVEGGTFMMGSTDFDKANISVIGEAQPDEIPAHLVTVGPFWISRTEVTVEQYEDCVEFGPCKAYYTKGQGPATALCGPLPGITGQHPAACLRWEDAEAVARWFGGRLPTEAEWEYVATQGGKDIKYPWGNEEPNCETVVAQLPYSGGPCQRDGPAPVCEVGAVGRSDGICDLAGNVWEITEDIYYDNYNYVIEHGSPAAKGGWTESLAWNRGYEHVMRGGGWSSDAGDLRARARGAWAFEGSPDVGARIVWDP